MLWLNDILQGILLGGLYALFAAGLSLVFGVMRLVNLAHGDFSIMGAFIALVIVGSLKVNPFYTILLVMIVMGVFGYLIQRGLFNFAMDAGPMQAILATFGIAIIIQNLLLEGFSADSKGLDAGWIENSFIKVSNQVVIGWFPLITLLVSVLVLFSLQLFLSRTRTGRAIRAVSQDETGALMVGIDLNAIMVLTMGLSCALAAVAGASLLFMYPSYPSVGLEPLYMAWFVVIIVGLGNVMGALAGGFLVALLKVLTVEYVGAGWDFVIPSAVMILVLIFKPNGIFGSEVRGILEK